MHAHDQMVLIERDKWMMWRKKVQDNSLVGFMLIAKDKWMLWRKEVQGNLLSGVCIYSIYRYKVLQAHR
jgi:hypothetical protein